MAVNEEIVAGKKFRRLIDIATNKWRRYSFWNKAKDTECEDGTDVETKVGAIKGITTSTNVSETGYAADAKTVSEINQSLSLLISNTSKHHDIYFIIGTNADAVGHYISNSVYLPSGYKIYSNSIPTYCELIRLGDFYCLSTSVKELSGTVQKVSCTINN